MNDNPSFFLILIWVLACFGIGLFATKSLESNQTLSVRASEPCTTPSPTPSATPTPSPSSSPSPSPSPAPVTNVYLTEFMACPASGNEWLELYNGTATEIIVTNWQIIDETGNKKYLNGTIPSNSFLQFEWTGSLLNNTGDAFMVITATGQTIGTASYTTCTTGISFVYESGEWVGALDSPGEESSLNTSTLPNSTAAAYLSASAISEVTSSLASNLTSVNTTLPAELTNTASPPPYSLPTLNVDTNHLSLTTAPLSPQSKYGNLPAISVIMGGLFQLLPSSATLYGNTKKYFT